MTERKEEFESKLMPILREGIEVVKMILFVKLKEQLARDNPDWPPEYRGKIIGAVINDIFGIVNPEEIFVKFTNENKEQIAAIIKSFPVILEELLIPLTDALRVMVLCDYQEGVDNSAILLRAQENGVFLVERDMPMPNKFIELVRRLGAAYGLFRPPSGEQ